MLASKRVHKPLKGQGIMFVLGETDERFDNVSFDATDVSVWQNPQVVGVLASQFALFAIAWVTVLSGAAYLLLR